MLQRLDNTKWLWCLLALHAGSVWGSAQPVTVATASKQPTTVEAQAKFFQDFFSVQLSPYKIEFGHVCEDPNTWEQRYEKKDFKNHRDMGKVRWGDKKGGYGEHYWDLNHAGHAGNHEDDSNDGDDGSYHESSNPDPYDEPSHNLPTYGDEEYEPEKSSYEENERAKRAHPKIEREYKERKYQRSPEKEYEEEPRPKKQHRKIKERIEVTEPPTEDDYEEEEEDEEEEIYEKPKPKRKYYKKQDDLPQQKEKNQFVLVVSHKDDDDKNQQNQYAPKKQPESSQYLPQTQSELPQYLPQTQSEPQQYVPQNQPDLTQYLPQKQAEYQYLPKQHLEPPQYVPYEGGAGVRQHQTPQPEVAAATTVPRLFLEPSTGHVVDRATGQAYILQPVTARNNYN